MKKILIIVCLLVSLVGCKNKQNEYVERALAVANSATNYLYQRNDSEFYLLLDSTAKNRTSEKELSEEIDKLIKYYGNIREIGTDKVFYTQTEDILVNVPVRFTTGWLDVQYKINKNGSVKSFIVMPSDVLEESIYDEKVLDYVVEDKKENYVLTMPSNYNEKTPIVVMLHDKDANDWDYTLGANRIFKMIAYQLADNGIAVVRYDKLGSSYEVADTKEELLQEVTEVISSLKNTDYYNQQNIYLFGYGIAGYLMPYLANNLDAQGYIIGNAYSTKLLEEIADENRYVVDKDISMTSESKKERYSQIDASIEVINNLVVETDYEYKLFGYSSAFWIEDREYDVLALTEIITKPIMVIGCDKDYQVDEYQYNNWKHYLKGKDNVSYCYLKNVDHYFLTRKATSLPNDIYSTGNISSTLIKELVKFLGEN